MGKERTHDMIVGSTGSLAFVPPNILSIANYNFNSASDPVLLHLVVATVVRSLAAKDSLDLFSAFQSIYIDGLTNSSALCTRLSQCCVPRVSETTHSRHAQLVHTTSSTRLTPYPTFAHPATNSHTCWPLCFIVLR